MKQLYFVNPFTDWSSISVKIWHLKWIVYVKNHLNLSDFLYNEKYLFRSTLWKYFFGNFNFWTTLLLKSCPISDEKSCFLGPSQLAKGKWFYQLHIFQIQWRIFFTIFKKSSLKKCLQLDSNSWSAFYKTDAVTIGPQSFFTRKGKNC